MEKRKQLITLAMLVMLIATIACDFSFGDSRSEEEKLGPQLTMISIQGTQTAVVKPPEEEAAPPPETDDAEEDADDNDDQQASSEACYVSKWTGVETIPDGTQFDPGDSFVKSWTLRNDGTCEWTTDFRMVFESGKQMGGPASNYLTEVVAPGETYKVDIPMTAPSSDGDYSGFWRFKAADGTKMGQYWVKITVGEPAPPPAAFAVTSVSYSVSPEMIIFTCPGKQKVVINANITTSAGGTVSYKWDDSQGCPSGCPTKTVDFGNAGTKTVQHKMTVGTAGDYWAKLYIDDPNHQWFDPANFHAYCN